VKPVLTVIPQKDETAPHFMSGIVSTIIKKIENAIIDLLSDKRLFQIYRKRTETFLYYTLFWQENGSPDRSPKVVAKCWRRIRRGGSRPTAFKHASPRKAPACGINFRPIFALMKATT
jgi:hypothetical protein